MVRLFSLLFPLLKVPNLRWLSGIVVLLKSSLLSVTGHKLGLDFRWAGCVSRANSTSGRMRCLMPDSPAAFFALLLRLARQRQLCADLDLVSAQLMCWLPMLVSASRERAAQHRLLNGLNAYSSSFYRQLLFPTWFGSDRHCDFSLKKNRTPFLIPILAPQSRIWQKFDGNVFCVFIVLNSRPAHWEISPDYAHGKIRCYIFKHCSWNGTLRT